MTTPVIGAVVLAVLIHGLRLGTDGRHLWSKSELSFSEASGDAEGRERRGAMPWI